jgi:hypothetical protein
VLTKRFRDVTKQRREVVLELHEVVLSRGDPAWRAALAWSLLGLPRMNQIKLGLNHKNAVQRLAQGNAIKTALTGNADFPLLDPPLSSLDTVLAELEARLIERQLAVEAAQAATESLRAAEAAYDMVITRIAASALSAVAGDAAKLGRGGFVLRREGTPTRELAQVANLRVETNGYTGRLKLRWQPVRGAKAYQVQLCPDPMTDTSFVTARVSTRSRLTLDGLTSATKQWVRVRGVIGDITGEWSEPVGKIVP